MLLRVGSGRKEAAEGGEFLVPFQPAPKPLGVKRVRVTMIVCRGEAGLGGAAAAAGGTVQRYGGVLIIPPHPE